MTSSLQKSLIHYGWFGPDSSLYCPNTDFFIYYGLIVAHIWGLSFATPTRHVLLHMASQDWFKHRPIWAFYQFYSNLINKSLQKKNSKFSFGQVWAPKFKFKQLRRFQLRYRSMNFRGRGVWVVQVKKCTGKLIFLSRQIFINFHIFEKTFWNLYHGC